MEVHRCRFVEHVGAGVSRLALNKNGTRLAVARANAAIEIWDTSRDWTVIKIIAGGEDKSVEAIVWGPDNRLFSSGLEGQITEWNIKTLRPKSQTESSGGAVWAIAINDPGSLLAAGCEDGCVRLFEITKEGLVYKKTLVGDKGRILSLSWQPESNFLVTGSSQGVIRRWNTTTGRPTHRMTVESYKEKTVVWAVAVLKDGTIVSGDSMGHVQFWDGEMGTLLESFSTHAADVLTVLAHPAGDRVFAGGIDPLIVEFRFLKDKMKWVVGEKSRAHTHDVKSLTISSTGEMLISGSVDTTLVAYHSLRFPKIARETHAYPAQPIVSLAKEKKLLCCFFPTRIEIWRLGESYHYSPLDQIALGSSLSMTKKEEKLIELNSKVGGHFVCCSISDDGKWLAASNVKEFKLFRIDMLEKQGRVALRKVRPADRKPGLKVAFTPDSKRVILTTYDGNIHIFSLEDASIPLITSFPIVEPTGEEAQNAATDKSTTTVLAVSPTGKHFAVGDTQNRIHLYDLAEHKNLGSFPVYYQRHTCLAFHPTLPLLIVGYVNHELLAFDLESGSPSEHYYCYQPTFTTVKDRNNKFIGLAFNPENPKHVLAYGLTFIFSTLLYDARTDGPQQNKVVFRNGPANHKSKRLKKDETNGGEEVLNGAEQEDEEEAEAGEQPGEKQDEEVDAMEVDGTREKDEEKPLRAGSLIFRYSPLLYFDSLAPGSFVVVERPWLTMFQKLPPPLYRPRYGT